MQHHLSYSVATRKDRFASLIGLTWIEELFNAAGPKLIRPAVYRWIAWCGPLLV